MRAAILFCPDNHAHTRTARVHRTHGWESRDDLLQGFTQKAVTHVCTYISNQGGRRTLACTLSQLLAASLLVFGPSFKLALRTAEVLFLAAAAFSHLLEFDPTVGALLTVCHLRFQQRGLCGKHQAGSLLVGAREVV